MTPELNQNLPKKPNTKLVLTNSGVREDKSPYRVVFDCSFSVEESEKINPPKRFLSCNHKLIDSA